VIYLINIISGTANVLPLLGSLRFQDQITLILPYIYHEKFKVYFFKKNATVNISNLFRIIFLILTFHKLEII
jgi:hypothetical protein